MVLGFGTKKKKGQDAPPPLRPSPSLPELRAQGIAWPQNLVDISVIYQKPPTTNDSPQRAAKTSFQSDDRSPIPFHKPFRGAPGSSPDAGNGSISALYMSNAPPSAFPSPKRAQTIGVAPSVRAKSIRKARVAPPTFNIMVAGSQGTGKTSLLRLLLDTADISPTATVDQRVALEQFLHGRIKSTNAIQAACVEICESRFDRVLLSTIDTPGLDFRDGHELKLERQVSQIVKYLDLQFADTMGEESKVVRQSKGDQHVHLCIYMIDPSSVVPASMHRARSSMPSRSRSQSTASRPAATPAPIVTDQITAAEDDGDEEPLSMSPAEIRVIRRLSTRVNVLPVIARADSLTDDKLVAVKKAIRKDLHGAGLGFGLFEPAKAITEEVPEAPVPTADADGEGTEDGEERPARPVIKLRGTRRGGRSLSRSRSRRDLSQVTDAREPLLPDPTDTESVANVRFSAHIVSKADLGDLMPFALIAPEDSPRRRPLKGSVSLPMSNGHIPATEDNNASNRTSRAFASDDGHTVESMITSPTLATSQSWQNMPYLQGPPKDLKGVFTRKFRWGTVDVLDPNHCDFAALRTAVLLTHMKILKNNTKEVLYEKYRTEKLLARRATHNISDEDRKQLLKTLGL